MHQNAVLDIASNDSLSLATEMVGAAVAGSLTRRSNTRDQTWVAEVEPLSILIHSLGHSYVASLIDRRLRCTVELAVESDLESAKISALTYAEQYMHLDIGEVSWLLPKAVQWNEFIAVRSTADLQARISEQRSTTTVSRL